MARDVGQIIQQAQQQLRDESPWIWLYEVEVPADPPTYTEPRRYRFTNYTQNVEFGTNSLGAAITYYAFPSVHGDIEQSRDGDVPSITITVANATRELGIAIDTYGGLIGQRAVVRLVNSTALDTPESGIRWDALVRRTKVQPDTVSIEISSYNLTKSQFPRWRYMRNSCPLRWGGPACGYIVPGAATNTVGGGFDFCPKSYAACAERGEDELTRGVTVRHPFRFGGFRGIQGS